MTDPTERLINHSDDEILDDPNVYIINFNYYSN